jgi:polysaccharide deacetylase family protein (PEP-CTERM system associated)
VHAVTLDVEEWYHAHYGPVPAVAEGQETRLFRNLRWMLDTCERFGLRSTCFVVGSVAEAKPGVVREIHRRGHEVASHGYAHRLVYEMTPEEFESDLARSIETLQRITGEAIRGFRAPSWSVSESVLPWFYEILGRHRIEYSSSVYPGRTFLYGIPGFPCEPHHPVVNGSRVKVREHPVPVASILGQRIGFSGGFYFRLFPLWFIRWELGRQERDGREPFVYLHTREIDPAETRLELGRRNRFIHYHGVGAAAAKFERLCAFLGQRRAREQPA